MANRAWVCIVSAAPEESLLPGADLPMRGAVHRAFRDVTGKPDEVLSSAWVSAETAEHLRKVFAERED